MADLKMCIYFEDQCPRIKCGWRVVMVKIGHKWVHFTDTANGRKGKVPLGVGEKMVEHGYLPEERKQYGTAEIGNS